MKDATQFHIRPARPEEAGLFYTPHPEEDKRLGTVGHVRMDFGRSGNEFWHTWWPRGPEELNSPAFKLELQEVVDTLRESVLKNRFAMERFCYEHGGKISGGWTQNYGYIVETEHYRYCLRCNPSPGDYNCYCTAYDLDVQRQKMARDKPLVGRVTYANGDAQEFTDAEAFLKCVREELPYRPTTGFRYEVLTDDPVVRKTVDDIIFDFYGEEAPCQQEDHEPRPEQGMTFGGKPPDAEAIRALMLERAPRGSIRRAADFFKLIRYSFSGGAKSFGGKPCDIRRFFHLIWECSRRLANVIVENKDFEEVIRQYDRAGAVIYCDPPYYKAESCYEVEFPPEDHQRLHDVLVTCEGYFIVSYNYQDYICELYQDCYIFRTSRPNSMSQTAGSEYEEIVITNYDPRKACWQLSMDSLLGGDGDTRYELIHEPEHPLKI